MADVELQVGSRAECRAYNNIPDKDGKIIVRKIPDPFGKSKREISREDDEGYALVSNHNYSTQNPNVLESVTLTVNSPKILEAFRDVVKSYAPVASNFTTSFELRSPFQMLIHFWNELESYLKETEDAEMRMHLNLLFQFMRHELEPERKKVLAMIASGHTHYLDAWVIYRPGDLVYCQEMGHGWLLRCSKTAYEESRKLGPYMEVHCTYTDHDGERTGEASHVICLYQKRMFGSGHPAKITDLPVYPRKFFNDQDSLEETLEKRGEKFLSLRGMSVNAYSGLAQYLREPPWDFWDPDMEDFDQIWLPYTEGGRVILDRKTFQEEQYSKRFAIRETEPEAMLCPPYAMGYSIDRKEWCRFFVDHINTIKWKENVWENIILDTDQKEVLQALVESHHYRDDPRNQPEQKGKGLVILLHGSPGSGKTLTAETAAEGSQKALVTASMSDLNPHNNPRLFERNLKHVLQYATLWRAVVLLDEADVFLEARDEKAGDPERNALVAVFLSALEYFSGIVFLTTNRLRSFDKAMKSRVHLALGYTHPKNDVRRRIWSQCLGALPADEFEVEDVGKIVSAVAHRDLNGREISNAVNTARTIARFKKSKLQLEHIARVLSVREEFDIALELEKKKAKTQSMQGGGGLRQNSILDPDA